MFCHFNDFHPNSWLDARLVHGEGPMNFSAPCRTPALGSPEYPPPGRAFWSHRPPPKGGRRSADNLGVATYRIVEWGRVRIGKRRPRRASFEAAGYWTRLMPFAPSPPNNLVPALPPRLAFPVKVTVRPMMLVAPPGSLLPAKWTAVLGK